jgi:hypothetical protein
MPPTATTNTGLANAPLNDFLGKIESQIINPLITLLALVAFVVFIFGVVMYILNADNDEKRKQGQSAMIWGIVGLVIIFGAMGIVFVLQSVASAI